MNYPSPPVTVPSGQFVTWSLPFSTTNSGSFGGMCEDRVPYGWTVSSSVNPASGAMAMSGTCGLAASWMYWSGFSIPYIPPTSEVVSIYPCFVASGFGKEGTSALEQWANAGTGITPGQILPFGPGGTVTNWASDSSSEEYDATTWLTVDGEGNPLSIGDDLSILASSGLIVQYASSSVANGGWQLHIDVSFVGIAVYAALPSNAAAIPSVAVNVGNTRPIASQ